MYRAVPQAAPVRRLLPGKLPWLWDRIREVLFASPLLIAAYVG